MPGLDPGIHLIRKKMDCRVKPGNDDVDAPSRYKSPGGVKASCLAVPSLGGNFDTF
jgi:hypothetical protein